ncbi:MAG: hypothetical protein AAF223_03555 [Bacteroidota bacterium]
MNSDKKERLRLLKLIQASKGKYDSEYLFFSQTDEQFDLFQADEETVKRFSEFAKAMNPDEISQLTGGSECYVFLRTYCCEDELDGKYGKPFDDAPQRKTA